jgi:hypothetical protein
MALYGIALVVIPMLVSLAASRIAFNKQIRETEKNYLSIAMKIVRNKMESHLEALRNTGVIAAKEIVRQNYMVNGDNTAMHQLIADLHEANGIWDYAVILDRNNNVLVKASPKCAIVNRAGWNGSLR